LENKLAFVTQKDTISMATPEAAVKIKLRSLFRDYTGLFHYWPVPSGYGSTTLDVLGCYRGRFFIVETKASKKKPTLRQQNLLNDAERAMAKTFVISGVDSPVFDDLRDWLAHVRRTVAYDPHITPDPVNRAAI
jgi:hypothetical protein